MPYADYAAVVICGWIRECSTTKAAIHQAWKALPEASIAAEKVIEAILLKNSPVLILLAASFPMGSAGLLPRLFAGHNTGEL